jgi:hypothetical protein
MAEPIANDWKAINDRMQQIQAERSPSFGPCRQCSGRGWIPGPFGGFHKVVICGVCQNPMDQPQPQIMSRV